MLRINKYTGLDVDFSKYEKSNQKNINPLRPGEWVWEKEKPSLNFTKGRGGEMILTVDSRVILENLLKEKYNRK